MNDHSILSKDFIGHSLESYMSFSPQSIEVVDVLLDNDCTARIPSFEEKTILIMVNCGLEDVLNPISNDFGYNFMLCITQSDGFEISKRSSIFAL